MDLCEGVWVVSYSNYEPAEVDSLWRTKEAAEEYVKEQLDTGGWTVEYWHLGD